MSRRKHRQNATRRQARRLLLESLEPRQMLTTDPGVPVDVAIDPTCGCPCESTPGPGGANRTSLWAGPGLNRLWFNSLDWRNFGREVTITLPDPDGPGGPLASPVLYREYDAVGNLILERDPLGAETTYQYDEAARLVSMTGPDPDGSGELASPVTAYQYDKAGNLISTTDPLSNVTQYTYDARNRRTHEILADPDAGGPLTSPTTVYAYNAASELTSLTDPVNNVTTWQYDGLGRVKQETNQLNKTRTFEYDAASNLTKRTDRLGRILQFEYDTLNHLTAEKWYDGTTLVRTLSFSYDAADQLMSASDPAATFSYSYDGLGRLTTETQDLAGQTPLVEFQSKYNANSRRTELLALIGGVADFKNTYQFDNLSRLISLQQGQTAGGNAVATKRVDFAYDTASRYTKVTRYADIAGLQHVVSSHYLHDLLGRMTKLTHNTVSLPLPLGEGWGEGVLASYQYAYDVGSRFTSIDSYLDGLTEYTHDNTDQLKTADHTGQTDEAYSYDVNGNRTMTGYSTGTNNQLLSDGTYNYTYDDEGNRLTKTKISTGEKEEYSWDHRNRLTGVTFKNSGGTVTKTVVHSYDVFNRWIKRSVDPDGPGSALAVDTYFAHEDGQIVYDFDGPAAGDLTHRYLWCEDVDQILAAEDVTSLTQAGNVLWPLTDHLGTTRDLADRNESTGVTSITNHRRFDSYGNLVSETNSAIDLLFAFTGRAYDESAGLQNNLNRWYDAVVGRWLSEDPIGFKGDATNIYRYVTNGPTAWIDPVGMDIWLEGAGPGEPIFHMSLCVGDPLKGYAAYSYGVDVLDPFTWYMTLKGKVYQDITPGGPILELYYYRTPRWVDIYISNLYQDMLGQEASYGLLTLNCQSWSDIHFRAITEELVRQGNATPATPPVRPTPPTPPPGPPDTFPQAYPF